MSARGFIYPARLTVWAENLSEADALAAEVATDVGGAEIGEYAPPSLDLTGTPPRVCPVAGEQGEAVDRGRVVVDQYAAAYYHASDPEPLSVEGGEIRSDLISDLLHEAEAAGEDHALAAGRRRRRRGS
jgi:hypothetical protein